jgi:predicted permease
MAKVTVAPGQARYTDAGIVRFVTTLADKAREIPGVRSVGMTSAMPMFNFEFTPVLPEGYQLPKGQSGTPVWSASIDEHYFETMEIPLLEGRGFDAHDDAGSRRVVIVNDTLARHYWPGGGAVGKRMRIIGPPGGIVEIVGVMKTTVYGFPGEVPQEAICFPYRQRPHGLMVILAQADGESAGVVQPLVDVVHTLDSDVPLLDAQTIETFYRGHISSFGTMMIRLVGGMGLMGMGLTMVGLYGLVSYSVNRRTREIGIRIAVGASHTRILRMVLNQGMMPAWAGLVMGLGLSVVTAGLMAQMVPFSRHVDERTYYVVVPLVAMVTLVAAFVPARRAARVDPVVALRCE